jgi:L-threonylcarbamoyladenylate synthase
MNEVDRCSKCYTDFRMLDSTLQPQIEKAIATLQHSGVVAYPTDTVYGLGASVANIPAIERIFAVKGRPKGMALPLLVADHDQIQQVASFISPTAWLLIRNFLPGGLTIILPKTAIVPDIITGGGKTVAIRIPDHPVPIAIIKGLGQPIVGTSANLSGQPSALTAAEVKSQLGTKVDMIIDGGQCSGGIESTVVDLSGKHPIIRRLGAISLEQLQRTCPDIELAQEVKNANRNR